VPWFLGGRGKVSRDKQALRGQHEHLAAVTSALTDRAVAELVGERLGAVDAACQQRDAVASAARAQAVAAPIPDEAPVMTATRRFGGVDAHRSSWSVDAAGGAPGVPLRVVVVEEQGLAAVHPGDADDLVVGEP